MTRRQERIVITGDDRLRKELADVCRSAGFLTGAPGSAGARSALCAFEVTNLDRERKKKNLRAIERSVPSARVIFSSSVTVTVDEQAGWLRNPGRLVGISALPGFIGNRLTEIAPGTLTSRERIAEAGEILGRCGKSFRIVQDRIGMVFPRIICMLINEAAFALTEQAASPQNLDKAMKLGARYPAGPVELIEKVGASEIVAVLDALARDLGEERYRTAPLLRQLALQTRFS
ncbi:MAG TPA: 3-hydroxyacyl-CoA dehydrogenase family protein [Bacteroidota bacterium]|nr:3-hydroxyacyl-CoA dehydrogenase family protein [Bacteroidota bacterium]